MVSFPVYPGGLPAKRGRRDRFPGFKAYYEGVRAEGGRRRVGDTFWFPLGGGRTKPEGVVVTVSVDAESSSAEAACTAVRRALERAESSLTKAGGNGRRTIALPTFLVGKGDVYRDLPAAADPQLRAAWDFVQGHDVDVMFVPHTAATYRAWAAARRKTMPAGTDRGPELPPELVEALRAGECVVFAGSGISKGAGLPDWDEFVDELAEELGVSIPGDRRDLDFNLDVAQCYRDVKGDAKLEERIRARFSAETTGARPTPAHLCLAALPVQYFVTANFDDLLERSLEGLRRDPVRVVAERDVSATGGREGFYVVKFHGCAAEGKEIVLSRDDYDDFFERRPAMAVLLQGLLLNRTFLFVGYGLRDPDFRMIHHRIVRMLQGSQRTAFATCFSPLPGPSLDQWGNRGVKMVQIPGGSREERPRQLLKLLDRLLEEAGAGGGEVLSSRPEDLDGLVFPEVWRSLQSLPGALSRKKAVLGSAGVGEVTALAATLRFLVKLGWRGDHPKQAVELLLDIADHPGLPARDKLDLLRLALSLCEKESTAKKIRKRIRAIAEAPGKGAGQGV